MCDKFRFFTFMYPFSIMKTYILSLLFCISTVMQLFSQDTISVSLTPGTPGYKIPSDFAGLSYEKSELNKGIFGTNKDTLIRLLQTLGIQSVRMGGNSVDKDTFSTNATSTHFTKNELDSFYLCMQKAGCKVLMGLNFGGDFDPTLASNEVAYIMSKYSPIMRGFEVGNEPDLYHSNGLRPTTYTVGNYKTQYSTYQDSILKHTPSAIFTGPVAATNYNSFTLPFCRTMHGKFTMLTQHYYVAAAYSLSNHAQIINLLSAAHQNSLLTEVNALVNCADSAGVPFRMAECNSLYNGGQWGVSDSYASSLWTLDYMYALASKKCAGVNFHGALGGPYSPLSYKNHIYAAQPMSYGILAFEVGSKGSFIPQSVSNNHINLNVYSTIDSLNNIYTTIVNKDTLTDGFIELNAGNSSYINAAYILLSATALADTTNISLGGQTVNAYGTCSAYTWQNLTVSNHTCKLFVKAGSAAIIEFSKTALTSIDNMQSSNSDWIVYPNPSNGEFTIQSPSEEDTNCKVVNSLGQVVEQFKLTKDNNFTHQLKATEGVYYLINEGVSEKNTLKIIVLK